MNDNKLDMLDVYEKNFKEYQQRFLEGGYLAEGEKDLTDIHNRICRLYFPDEKDASDREKLHDALSKGFLVPSTPILSYCGSEESYTLPISCFINEMQDNMGSILRANFENCVFTVRGGGCSTYYGALRPEGSPIRGRGKASSVVSQICADAKKIGILAQGETRRGAMSAYMDIDHEEIEDFIKMRSIGGTPEKTIRDNACHHGVVISDDFMYKVEKGDKDALRIWNLLIETRITTGEPYIMFKDTVDRAKPEAYVKNGWGVKCSNLCSEITLRTDKDTTAVCCLASLDLCRIFEYAVSIEDEHPHCALRRTLRSTVEIGLKLLDRVLREFVLSRKKCMFDNITHMDTDLINRALDSACSEKSVGLGVMGYFDMLDKYLYFNYFDVLRQPSYFPRSDCLDYSELELKKERANITKCVFECIDETAQKWKKELGLTHATAIAPTASISKLIPNIVKASQGIDPVIDHIYTEKDKLGTSLPMCSRSYRDNALREFQGRGCIPLKTAFEHCQFELIELASIRQKYIDQSQSFNLFIDLDRYTREDIGKMHYVAWKSGLKTMYYLRTKNIDLEKACSLTDGCEVCQ